ncbi:hypothetical protein CRENBAI_009660 [Crenichthys baileyi]|uniref:Uncharacterized protein n=1 Tax=Crenichthys baileyi TaxID=28760 RepID=A0AAV9R4K4_9TELE
MAASPIETTLALQDLKVRRQRIIFQWWQRRIGGVKWCLPTTLASSPPELLQYSQDGINIAPNPSIITLTDSTPRSAQCLHMIRSYSIQTYVGENVNRNKPCLPRNVSERASEFGNKRLQMISALE